MPALASSRLASCCNLREVIQSVMSHSGRVSDPELNRTLSRRQAPYKIPCHHYLFYHYLYPHPLAPLIRASHHYQVQVSGTEMVQRAFPPLTTSVGRPAVPIRVVGTPNGGTKIAAITSSTPSLSLSKTRKTQFQPR